MTKKLSPAEVISKHAARIMAIDGVIGMAEGVDRGRGCIQIHLARENGTLKKTLPSQLDGYPVVTIVTGPAELF
ncbi:MAG: hypothetical protein AB1772_12890 [Candidatus Zixiibacteriota bacterium]